MTQNKINEKMNLKDVIKVTLFGVIGFVISVVTGMAVSALGTFGTFVHTSLGAILTGPLVIVMCQKVHKKGSISLYYLISAIVYLVMGLWPMSIILILSAAISGILLGNSNNYYDYKKIGIAYVIAELIYSLHGFIFILVMGVEGLVRQFPNMFTVEKAQWMKDFFLNPRNMAIILSIQIIASIIGVFFGKYIHKKFFAKNNNGTVLN